MDRTLAEVGPILPRPHPAVMFREVSDGGAVLLQMEEEVYFGLNAVGARIWQLLPPASTSLDDLCAQLGASYPDADPDRIRADATELIAQLLEQKLVVGTAEKPAP